MALRRPVPPPVEQVGRGWRSMEVYSRASFKRGRIENNGNGTREGGTGGVKPNRQRVDIEDGERLPLYQHLNKEFTVYLVLFLAIPHSYP